MKNFFKKKDKKETKPNTLTTVTKKEIEERAKEIEALIPTEKWDPNAYVSLRHIDKVYDNGVQAVFDFNLDIAKHEFIVSDRLDLEIIIKVHKFLDPLLIGIV